MKKEKRQLIQFKLENKEDFIVYLNELISRLDRCIVKHKRFLEELKIFIYDQKLKNEGIDLSKIRISEDVYHRFLSMLSGIEFYEINLVGDGQSSSISYFKLRSIIEKRTRKGTLQFKMRELDEDYQSELLEFNLLRNWFNHVPESLLTAQIELIKKEELPKLSLNPIEITYFNYCSLEYVEDMYNQSFTLYNGIRKAHQNMKKDYSFLLGEKVEIKRIYSDKILQVDNMSVAKLSSEIQGLSK